MLFKMGECSVCSPFSIIHFNPRLILGGACKEVIAVDLPGFGRSIADQGTRPAEDALPEKIVDYLCDFLHKFMVAKGLYYDASSKVCDFVSSCNYYNNNNNNNYYYYYYYFYNYYLVLVFLFFGALVTTWGFSSSFLSLSLPPQIPLFLLVFLFFFNVLMSLCCAWLIGWQVDAPREIILVGHSFGAYIACKYTRRHPHHPIRLVLLAPAGLLPTAGVLGYYWSWILASGLIQTPKHFGTTGARIMLAVADLLHLPSFFHSYYLVRSVVDVCWGGGEGGKRKHHHDVSPTPPLINQFYHSRCFLHTSSYVMVMTYFACLLSIYLSISPSQHQAAPDTPGPQWIGQIWNRHPSEGAAWHAPCLLDLISLPPHLPISLLYGAMDSLTPHHQGQAVANIRRGRDNKEER